ncbi:helix-turn-helix transcriptional regulator [Paracoccus sp. (in: a-proteobacteria)]|uniref:helix-turn-helix domain-containing protein n=1 Tax=Paracoccus sp. TaxID=267 RepID=UPI002AFE30B2|nr:helix-turn-helix transcriptional regulator [Paracoccus sp. (in: a-proteobacteria)]
MGFGERFRVARARAGFTLAEVGKRCGVSAQAVKKWEDGVCYPASSSLMVICHEFDCSVEWLMCSDPLDFRSTDKAPDGRHAKYWVREAMDEYFARRTGQGGGE